MENVNLIKVFEALKGKADEGTPFQWRKLREVCLISKTSNVKGKGMGTDIDFIIQGKQPNPKQERKQEQEHLSNLLYFSL